MNLYRTKASSFWGGPFVRLGLAFLLFMFGVRGGQESPPANDSFASARLLEGLEANDTGDNTLATTETGEPVHANTGTGHSLWWIWMPVQDAYVQVWAQGTNFGPLVVVYEGEALQTLMLRGGHRLGQDFDRRCFMRKRVTRIASLWTVLIR